MKQFLLEDGGEQGIQAWKNIQASTINEALEKATKFGKAEGGQAIFNVNKFRDFFSALKKTDKFNTLFDQAEKELIDDIIEIGTLRLPKSSVALGGGPTQIGVAVESVKKEMIKKLPAESLVGGIVKSIFSAREANRLTQPAQKTIEKLSQ
jgi:hypothetical protein